jgi:hypothetical protein
MSDEHPAHDSSAPAHGGDEAALGPIDLAAWGATMLGIAAGLLVAVLMAVAAYR